MAASRIASLSEHFADLPDPRLDRRKRHSLNDILVVAVCGILAGCNTWADVERFGIAKLAWFRTFLKLPNGIPSHDTFGRLFAIIDPVAFGACYTLWMTEVCEKLGFKQIAVDGKTMRGSGGVPDSAAHIVTAFATANGVALGQEKVDEKSNEITAIPALLEILDLSGALVSVDAMGCQTAIAQQVVEQGGDYLLGVKRNQPTLHDDIERHAGTALAANRKAGGEGFCEKGEKGHGRLERRACHVFDAKEVLSDPGAWKGVRSVVVVESERTVDGKTTQETRYYISSRSAPAKVFAEAVRGHWGVENNLHWMLDVCFGDDDSRVRVGHGPENFALLKRLALSALKQMDDKDSIRGRRLIAGWNNAYLEKVLLKFLAI